MSFTKEKDSDNYSTDKIGWEIIKDFIPKDKKIWCPFYCDGKQKDYLHELGFTDIIHKDEDFFLNDYEDSIIIDNPPFSKFKVICERLKQFDRPFIIIGFSKIILMKWFQKLFKEHLQIIIPTKRTTFSHLINPKKGYTPPYGTQYYCYKMNLEKDLLFL
tara:strand:+ start:1061 stop:1540 length:480 start_codon:yes stop_codon:yes gene_type:complete